MRTSLSYGNIFQQTGANSTVNYYDFVNNPTTNYYPIAFREVQALMITSAWERQLDNGLVSVTPFYRYNRMELLPSYTLKSDPSRFVQDYNSIGAQLRYRQDFAPWRTRFITGMDLEYSPGSYGEFRVIPNVTGNYMYSYRLGQQLYNYNVAYTQASPFMQVETSPVENLRITAGLRLDLLGYDYQNNLTNGAFASGLKGSSAIFYRPGSTNRDYEHLAPNLGFTYTFSPDLNVFANYRQGFRIPQQTDLFRSGVNADSIHLQPILVENVEGGLRSGRQGPLSWELVFFNMVKVNDIISYNANNTISNQTNNGKTRHTGVEFAMGYAFSSDFRVSGTAAYAEHEYLRWSTSPTNILDGKRIPAAPRSSGTVQATYTPSWLLGLTLEADYQYINNYAMNAVPVGSTLPYFVYGGYSVVNLRGEYAINENLRIFARVTNARNVRYATSAQASGNAPAYAPANPIQGFGGIALRF